MDREEIKIIKRMHLDAQIDDLLEIGNPVENERTLKFFEDLGYDIEQYKQRKKHKGKLKYSASIN
jgi:hypothetical protein